MNTPLRAAGHHIQHRAYLLLFTTLCWSYQGFSGYDVAQWDGKDYFSPSDVESGTTKVPYSGDGNTPGAMSDMHTPCASGSTSRILEDVHSIHLVSR